jgi:hypothetical protein
MVEILRLESRKRPPPFNFPTITQEGSMTSCIVPQRPNGSAQSNFPDSRCGNKQALPVDSMLPPIAPWRTTAGLVKGDIKPA